MAAGSSDRVSLCALDAPDMHALMDRRRRIAERICEAVRHRIGRDFVSPQGDVVSEELKEIEDGEGS